MFDVDQGLMWRAVCLYANFSTTDSSTPAHFESEVRRPIYMPRASKMMRPLASQIFFINPPSKPQRFSAIRAGVSVRTCRRLHTGSPQESQAVPGGVRMPEAPSEKIYRRGPHRVERKRVEEK